MTKTISLPGSIDTKIAHTLVIHAEGAAAQKKLENESFQQKTADNLYDFLINYCPGGVYKKFVKLIIAGDFGCNNYIGDHLGFSHKDIRKILQAKENQV